MMTRMKQVSNVDKYIADAPSHVQGKLRELRQTIQEVAPDAEEKISYSMPYYGYKGRLVYFAHAKHHIGVYIPPPVIEDHKNELKEYTTTKSAVQFPLDKELPLTLVKKLVRARMRINEEKEVSA